jgi:hypothetical protein
LRTRGGHPPDSNEELVDYMLHVFRDEGESTKTGVEAASWLADRGFRRPQQTTLIAEAEPAIMPSELNEEEIAAGMRRRLEQTLDGLQSKAEAPEVEA